MPLFLDFLTIGEHIFLTFFPSGFTNSLQIFVMIEWNVEMQFWIISFLTGELGSHPSLMLYIRKCDSLSDTMK